MIQIHPKRAFLNSDVVFSNKGQESVIIEDSLTNKSFSLSPGENYTSRFPAGEHKVTIQTVSGLTEEHFFVVEDALKFGGSDRKKSFVFDSNPWAIIVMKDRTYFFNEKTKEQFVEHNLSPDLIEEISPDYLLFSTGGDYSFFSLLTMSFEKTLSSSKFVYCGNKHCLLSYKDGLYLYRTDPKFIGERLDNIICEKYLIDEKEGIVYTFNKEEYEVTSIRLLNHPQNGIYEQFSKEIINGRFVCFLGCHSMLYTSSNNTNGDPNLLFCKDLSQVDSITQIYSGEQPISYINGISVWESSSYDILVQKFRKCIPFSEEGSRLTINVIENSRSIYHIQTIEHIKIKGHIKECDAISSLYSSGIHIYSEGKKLNFEHRGLYDYVTCEKGTFVFFKNTYYKTIGDLLFTKYDDPYIKYEIRGEKTYTTIEGKSINCDPEKSRPSYGLFFIRNNEGSFFYWLKTNSQYVGESVDIINDIIVVSGGNTNISPRFFMKNGKLIPVPESTDNMVAYSSTGKTILYEKGGYYSFARYVDMSWEYTDNLVLSIYDSLRVNDAVFCSDGDSFIYQKEGEMVLYDFATEKETVFPSDAGIKYNVNGYRPYCNKDFYSRPVIVDPLTHRVVDNNFLNQFRFSNVEGTVYYEKRIIKRCLVEDGSEISEYKYQSLRNEYDFTMFTNKDERATILQNRIRYCKEKMGKTPDSFSIELTFGDFVDSFVVRAIEYVVIIKNGVRKEVKIGAPLYFLNYVAFSSDSNRVAICGKYSNASGLCLIYDLDEDKVIHRSTLPEKEFGVGSTLAIWLGLFSKKGDVAYYDSTPNTYFIKHGEKPIRISGRSFLTFSPSGKIMAMSKQGYTPYKDSESFWGHQPCCDIFIAKTNDPKNCLCHFNDHGSGIKGIGIRRETIASASFSIDDKKLLSVSDDGVVVVRNLHLDV